jgi:hypothetical protein
MMSEPGFWARFVLAILATWRITHLLAREDGPGDVVVRLRTRLGSGALGTLMDCFHCLSLWVAAPLALLVARTPVDLLLAWPALSGAACLLERLRHEPVVIQSLPESKGETNNGMLWTEAVGDAEQPIARSGDAHAGRSSDNPDVNADSLAALARTGGDVATRRRRSE